MMTTSLVFDGIDDVERKCTQTKFANAFAERSSNSTNAGSRKRARITSSETERG